MPRRSLLPSLLLLSFALWGCEDDPERVSADMTAFCQMYGENFNDVAPEALLTVTWEQWLATHPHKTARAVLEPMINASPADRWDVVLEKGHENGVTFYCPALESACEYDAKLKDLGVDLERLCQYVKGWEGRAPAEVWFRQSVADWKGSQPGTEAQLLVDEAMQRPAAEQCRAVLEGAQKQSVNFSCEPLNRACTL